MYLISARGFGMRPFNPRTFPKQLLQTYQSGGHNPPPHTRTHTHTATTLFSKRDSTSSTHHGEFDDRFFAKLMLHVRRKDFDACMESYRRLKLSGYPVKPMTFNSILNVCYKAEHLDAATQLFEDMQQQQSAPGELQHLAKEEAGSPQRRITTPAPAPAPARSEQAYLALIRCNAAGGNVDKALKLVDEMESQNGPEPRLRTYHPILEAICASGDIDGALNLITTMQQKGIIPKSEHVELLISSAARTGALHRSSLMRERLDSLIASLSTELLGLQHDEMLRLTAVLSQSPWETVESDGVLVAGVDAIRGAISTLDLEKREAIAESLIYHLSPSHSTETSPVPLSSSGAVPVGAAGGGAQPGPHSGGSISSYQQKYKWGERYPQGTPQAQTPAPARIVDIDDATGCCPNCGGKLRQLLMTTEERARVRSALNEVVAASSQSQSKALRSFGEWLACHPSPRGGSTPQTSSSSSSSYSHPTPPEEEFVYIVDGANVAYHKQNFDEGKFSFKQIELVVNKLLTRVQPGERILVLIPYPYAQRVIPNSTKHKKGKKLSYLTAEDEGILEMLDREGMLYVVPQWANDDWYWMYATVNEGRHRTARVVTNDLMRDHRLAFLEPRPFIRWRNSQVIRFDLSTACIAPGADSSMGNPEKVLGNDARLEMQEGALGEPEVILTDPGTGHSLPRRRTLEEYTRPLTHSLTHQLPPTPSPRHPTDTKAVTLARCRSQIMAAGTSLPSTAPLGYVSVQILASWVTTTAK